jgi:hypothetical protein
MRQSFLFMLGAWGASFVIPHDANAAAFLVAARVLAGTATGLWLLHLAVFTLKVTNPRRQLNNNQVEGPIADVPALPRRRELIVNIPRSFLLAAMATALPVGSAFAQDHLSECLNCCARKLKACGNGGDCNVLYQNCVSSCNNQGSTPADWRCW